MPITHSFAAALARIQIAPVRVLLDTPGVEATVPMLRGVWGRALHTLDRAVYDAVFGEDDHTPPAQAAVCGAGVPPAAPQAGHPRHNVAGGAPRGYVLRPAPPDPSFAPAVDWIVIGPAIVHLPVLWRAWDVASGMGLGPRRQPFVLRTVVPLAPDGRPTQLAPLPSGGLEHLWTLHQAAWPCQPADTAPCRLVFRAPVRLRRQGKLIERPALPDLVVAACRRVREYLPPERTSEWDETARRALEAARGVPCRPWRGARLDLHRYSGRQRAELELQGVSGALELPAGPGPLWPLLAAAQWLHLGKAPVMGLGQMEVERM